MIISVMLPAYQESENLKNILPKINHVLKSMSISYEIIVVDTIETLDDTEDICNQNHCKYIRRKGGNLYGDAIRTGIENSQGDYIVIMDADGSHDPSDIIRFYNEMKSGKYDLIIGSRYCKGGKTDNGFILRLMSRVLNISYKIMFGLKVKDVSDSFRMYKGVQLRSIKTECNNFDIVEEILIVLNYSYENFSIYEVPIFFNKRTAGKSKRSLIKFIFSYLQTVKRLMKIKAKHTRN